jgi:hypothetical protein
MRNATGIAVKLWIVGALFCVASPAAAFGTVTMPVSGQGYIGMRNDGFAVVEVCNPTTHSASVGILGTHPGVGLEDDWFVRAANGTDNIGLVTGTISNACGHTFTPMIFNGHFLSINGRGGNDVVTGGNTPTVDNSVVGGDGNDIVVVAPGGAADGERGSDHVYGQGSNSSSEALYGGTGDSSSDYVCEWASSVVIFQMDGGPGTDARRGSGSDLTSNFESTDCALACQF